MIPTAISQAALSTDHLPSQHFTFNLLANYNGQQIVLERYSANQSFVDQTLRKLKEAYFLWSTFSYAKRSACLDLVASELEANKHSIANIESQRTLKSLQDATNQIDICINHWRYASQLVLNTPEYVTQSKGAYSRYEPYGTVALIIPYNFPAVVLCERLPYLLAAGNVAIIKPSELTTGSIAEIIEIVNKCCTLVVSAVIQADSNSSQLIVDHSSVDFVSFTGSTEVGRLVASRCGALLKPCDMELGGANPIVITKTANLQLSVDIALRSIRNHMGQACISTEKCYIEQSVYSDFENALYERIKSLSNDEPFSAIFQPWSVYERQLSFVSQLQMSNSPPVAKSTFGTIPLIYNDPLLFASEAETFGTILGLSSFSSLDDLMLTPPFQVGALAAILLSSDRNEHHKFVSCVRAGRIWINSCLDSPVELPLGGYGPSGFGRVSGRTGLLSYSTIKSVVTDEDIY